MPMRSELQALTKPQLVDFACNFFEDTGNLRQEMDALTKPDLYELLIENGADAEEQTPMPEVEAKVTKGFLDLGS